MVQVNKLKAAGLSIGVNVVLLISKIIAAIITGSVALFAECAHSLFDLFSSLLAYWGIRIAGKPVDETHSYGHDKFENLSSFLQAIFITLTACFVIYETINKWVHPAPVENPTLGVVLMIITIPVALYTSHYLSKTASSSGGSRALEADSAHFTTDVLSSVSVVVGLTFVRFGYRQGDILAAIAVGLIMFYISIKLIRDSYFVFMDYNPRKDRMDKIRKILTNYKGIEYHKLRARMAGNRIIVDVHVQVPGHMTVKESHALTGKIKEKLIKFVPEIKEITIHIEPREENEKAKGKKRS